MYRASEQRAREGPLTSLLSFCAVFVAVLNKMVAKDCFIHVPGTWYEYYCTLEFCNGTVVVQYMQYCTTVYSYVQTVLSKQSYFDLLRTYKNLF
jgi:hypothetical protein